MYILFYTAEADITKILGATGQKVNDAEVKSVIEKLKGKKIEDLIKNGLGKVGSVSVGGGSAPAPVADTKKADKKEEKKPEKKEEKKPEPKVEEEDFGGAGDLFGDF